MLGKPLPKEVISSSVLGKFKLEDIILSGNFLAPKSYCYINKDKEVLKYKGAAIKIISTEWFKSQYADPYRKEKVLLTNPFRLELSTLNIIKIRDRAGY